MTIGLAPVETQPLHEVVYERLRHALMSGQLAPGRKLTSRKLAKELGTSDMPVRSALMRLQALRALEQLPNGSMVLPAMTKARFDDLMTTRLVCEPAAARQAVEQLDRGGLLKLRQVAVALTAAAEDQDIDAYLYHNHDFKFAIYAACGSPSLLFLIETLWLQVGPFLRQFSGQFDNDLRGILELDYHDEIVKCLEDRDSEGVVELLTRDIRDGHAFLMENGQFE
ncbi:GntR family transcriptional regulator [Vreelandella boliviensis]|uniref:GntR family transcriptional regulator n=1 Tax=Vreelandella boliviensis LC1 TaxID=1072583 RepID=A0A265E1T1_9GAMM|nr:GntR family transcriptional regulator [Halomonas boliviensis]EHJ94677.1 HTH-type transcriptional regulator mcbR [Halomonas boliviensis LC1]OZT75485.1 GntR family transcriptional regulator [Halomonas boliviensis LC1]